MVGQFSERIAEAARERGDPVPAAAEPAEPWDEIEPVWRAYWALAHRRGWTVITLAVGIARVAEPLKLSEICVAADRFGFGRGDRFDLFLDLVSALDAAHLKFLDKR